MKYAEIERFIDIICWGSIRTEVTLADDQQITLILRNPTPKEKAIASSIYQKEYRDAIATGLPTEEQLLENYIEIGKWNPEKDVQIEGIKKDIQTLKKGLLDLLFRVNDLERVRELLRRAENKLLELLMEKNKLLSNSAENYALLCSQRYIISRITEDENGKCLWETQQDFNDCEDIQLINRLCLLFFEQSNIGSRKIREIARSNLWRSLWVVAKDVSTLFNGPIVEWSDNQCNLAYWSHIYDMVYEAYERPTREIIEDDDLLDSWLIRQGEKVEKRCNKEATENLVKGSHKRGDKTEHFIVTDREGAKKVYDANDNLSRAKIKARQRVIQKKGHIKDEFLPDTMQEIREKFMKQRHEKMKKA